MRLSGDKANKQCRQDSAIVAELIRKTGASSQDKRRCRSCNQTMQSKSLKHTSPLAPLWTSNKMHFPREKSMKRQKRPKYFGIQQTLRPHQWPQGSMDTFVCFYSQLQSETIDNTNRWAKPANSNPNASAGQIFRQALLCCQLREYFACA